jgi:hypothetical protein
MSFEYTINFLARLDAPHVPVVLWQRREALAGLSSARGMLRLRKHASEQEGEQIAKSTPAAIFPRTQPEINRGHSPTRLHASYTPTSMQQ